MCNSRRRPRRRISCQETGSARHLGSVRLPLPSKPSSGGIGSQHRSEALPAGITNRVGRSRRLRLHPAFCFAPGICTFADDGYTLSRPAPDACGPWWSRPFVTDVCSMFARMPRYTLAPLGIRSRARMRATGQNGSSRHVLALFDSSSRRISEQRSGLLIRGFGVRVPGGAPVLTWGYVSFRSFLRVRFVPMLAPCSLVSYDRVAAGLSNLAGTGPVRGLRRPSWLSQWSTPLVDALSFGSLIQLRSVKPAGSVQSHERRAGRAGRGQPQVSRERMTASAIPQ
jgi:hypothetical protein